MVALAARSTSHVTLYKQGKQADIHKRCNFFITLCSALSLLHIGHSSLCAKYVYTITSLTFAPYRWAKLLDVPKL
jgi:hypothetical protein